ncbi:Endoglucanase E-4 precursor [compost metagenome]
MNTSVSVSGLVSPGRDASANETPKGEIRLDSVGRREFTVTVNFFIPGNGTAVFLHQPSGGTRQLGVAWYGSSSWTVTDLLPLQTYKISLGPGIVPPIEINVTTLGANPTPPNHFTPFFQTESEVYFFWDGGKVDTGEPRFEIRRDGVLLEIVDKPPYRDNTPMQGRDHQYCIRTVDEEFLYSDPLCVTVKFKDVTAPTVPSDLRISNLGLILSWEPSQDSSPVVNYRIYQIEQDGGEIVLDTTVETEFAVTKLQPGRRYVFGVTAFDDSGNESERATIQYPAQGISLQRK